MDDVTFDIGQTHITTTESERTSSVVDTHEVEDRRVEVVHLHTVFDRLVTPFIGRTIDGPRFHAPTRHPNGKPVLVMVTPIGTLGEWGTPKFASPNHECVL